MKKLWNGMDVDLWAPIQTRVIAGKVDLGPRYSGYDFLDACVLDLGLPVIPLNIRYANFCDRLAAFKARVSA